MIFTGTDKALLDRTARMLDTQAKATAWEAITNLKSRRVAKLEFDRLCRDARDLRALGKRIATVAVKAAPKLEPEQGPQDRESPTTGAANGQEQPAG